MTGEPVAGLLLAAGGGVRFGGPKALVEFDGQVLVERAAGVMERAALQPRVVVLGADAAAVRRRAELRGCQIVVNAGWRSGMAGSLRCGLAALRGAAPAVVVTLVDQPLIGHVALTRLVEAWRQGATAAVATYDGEPANPVLLDASLWDEIAADATGDVGARRFLRRHPELVTTVACDDTGSAADIDTPDDLARLVALRGG
jgi:CTP:molybdopterin cytidylyltransferase MocA